MIKVLKPVAPKKVKREVKILRNLTGGPNIVALRDVVQDPSARYHSLVMEHVENVEWRLLFSALSELEVKYYTLQLLKVRSDLGCVDGPTDRAFCDRHWISCIREGLCIAM